MSSDKIFEALASSPRRQILAYLSEQELTAGDIAARFKMSAPAISRHLSVLENAGLISGERQGQFVMYKLNGDSLVNTLTQFAFSICPVGAPLKRESKAKAKSGVTKANVADKT
ncbi:metalloregulator ArsR/SmtB family transcription factor [Undibacterium pigrum]|uniref:ArsR family transcriptional regulator n=1 Tax=Undibacterium pigrum TaxID=401470 RepID=A0A318IVK5_9BURK|nr:metalloregulator ArsR/SmtB family transcription factor [Undibacterium pigrum]PXX37977.1 ArsR family transcriptional regulator [Undibacterium pigrum]